MQGIKAVVFDYDGVLAHGKRQVEGAAGVVRELRKREVKVFVLTDKSTLTRRQFQLSLRRTGFDFRMDEVLTSPMAVVAYLRMSEFSGSVLVIGEYGLRKEITDAGYRVVDKAPAGAVVVGMDRRINYQKITQALLAIRGGALFIAANYNPFYPVEDSVAPGSAAMVGAISAATQKEPDQNLGKPNTLLLESIAEKEGLKPGEMAIVGDSLKTDIALANAFGAYSVLVLTGCDSSKEAVSAEPAMKPKKIIKSLAGLLDLFPGHPEPDSRLR
jgi:4-nitrophenyl phosphatase